MNTSGVSKGAEENTPLVSVIIPVYNDSERLMRCLRALEKQTYSKDAYEVVVVNNASEEEVAPVVAQFKQAREVYEAQRGSYAARNRGIEAARGEILAFTDADCIPQETWIERGVERLTHSPSCGLVGGRIDFLFRVPDQPTPAEWYDSTQFLDQKRYIKEGNFAATANVFAWKRTFEEVGLFDASLRSGGDTEWGRRVVEHGYDILYADEARVYHPARRSYRALRQKKLRVLEGTNRFKKERGYPFHELLTDVIKDVAHHVKVAGQMAFAKGQYGWKEKARIFVAFPVQGMCVAFKRAKLWMGDVL